MKRPIPRTFEIKPSFKIKGMKNRVEDEGTAGQGTRMCQLGCGSLTGTSN